jgi:4,5-DOPA dioxygenase extradiol
MELGEKLPRPKGVVCVSAHWEGLRPLATGGDAPETIHDFSGPPALFDLSYPAPGSPGLANEALSRLEEAGFQTGGVHRRGIDHGTWIPLMLMYPKADIPVVQISVQTEESPAFHFKMGEALTSLREKDILILGSGGAVHNLDEIYQYSADADPPDYVREFDQWLEKQIVAGGIDGLLNYKEAAPEAARCHPYPAEHFLPLFVPMGAGKKGKRLHGSFLYGTLSMSAYAWD